MLGQDPEQEGPQQGLKRLEAGAGAGPRTGLGAAGAEPDHIPTVPSVRINNYLNFFHLRRDSNTGKHGKGKDIDPSQLLPAPSPLFSPPPPPLTIWSPLPPASALAISSLSHTQTSRGPPRQPAVRGSFCPQPRPSSGRPREDPTSQLAPRPDKPGLPWVNPHLLELPSSHPLQLIPHPPGFRNPFSYS